MDPDAAVATKKEKLQAALNLGWSVAELRGRLRYGHVEPPGTIAYRLPRSLHALPLSDEHSLTEQQIATRIVVTLLIEHCNLIEVIRIDKPSDWLQDAARKLDAALDDAEEAGTEPRQVTSYDPSSPVGRAWDAVADEIYLLDERIQDRLGVAAEMLAAYQLGRGLAETYWGLDVSIGRASASQDSTTEAPPADPASWEFLLGAHRTDLLCGYLRLLETDLPSLTVPAIQGSLRRWSQLVQRNAVRSHADAQTSLREQLQLWRAFLLGGRDPVSLAHKFSVMIALRQARNVARAFALEVIVGLTGVGLLAGAGYWIGANKTSSGAAVAISILGFFGVTGAGLAARAKARAALLYGRLREAFYADIVSLRASVLPPGVDA